MKNTTFCFLITLLCLTSCSKDESFDSELSSASKAIPELKKSSSSKELIANPPTDCDRYILTAIYSYQNCYNNYDSPWISRRAYKAYATTGADGAVNYDRFVEFYITRKKNGRYEIVDTGILKIDANASQSNQVPVFILGTVGEALGQVDVVIAQVKKADGTIDTCYTKRKMTTSVDNCWWSDYPINPELYGQVDVLYRSHLDFDGDYIDNDIDNDDDNDGIPDSFDTDNDNDGVSNTTDLDDDNDGILDIDEPSMTNDYDHGNDSGTGLDPDGSNDVNPNLDTDYDGIPDNLDQDDDNDGIPDDEDPDDDNDGIPDIYDTTLEP